MENPETIQLVSSIRESMKRIVYSGVKPSSGRVNSHFMRSDIEEIMRYHDADPQKMAQMLELHERTVGLCMINSKKLVSCVNSAPDNSSARLIKAESGLFHFPKAPNAHFATLGKSHHGFFIASPANYLNPFDLKFPIDPETSENVDRLTYVFTGNTEEEVIDRLISVEGGNWVYA